MQNEQRKTKKNTRISIKSPAGFPWTAKRAQEFNREPSKYAQTRKRTAGQLLGGKLVSHTCSEAGHASLTLQGKSKISECIPRNLIRKQKHEL